MDASPQDTFRPDHKVGHDQPDASRARRMDNLYVAVISVLATIVIGLIGYIFTRQTSQTDKGIERGQKRSETISDKAFRHDVDLASLQASVALLMSERPKCDAIAERITRVETWRDLAGPKIDEAHEGLRAVVRLEEQVRTLFNRLDTLPQQILATLRSQSQGVRA